MTGTIEHYIKDQDKFLIGFEEQTDKRGNVHEQFESVVHRRQWRDVVEVEVQLSAYEMARKKQIQENIFTKETNFVFKTPNLNLLTDPMED